MQSVSPGPISVASPSTVALETVDCLLEAVVAVRGCDGCTGRDVEFENRDGSAGLLALDEESGYHGADPDLFACDGLHQLSLVFPGW